VRLFEDQGKMTWVEEMEDLSRVQSDSKMAWTTQQGLEVEALAELPE